MLVSHTDIYWWWKLVKFREVEWTSRKSNQGNQVSSGNQNKESRLCSAKCGDLSFGTNDSLFFNFRFICLLRILPHKVRQFTCMYSVLYMYITCYDVDITCSCTCPSPGIPPPNLSNLSMMMVLWYYLKNTHTNASMIHASFVYTSQM